MARAVREIRTGATGKMRRGWSTGQIPAEVKVTWITPSGDAPAATDDQRQDGDCRKDRDSDRGTDG